MTPDQDKAIQDSLNYAPPPVERGDLVLITPYQHSDPELAFVTKVMKNAVSLLYWDTATPGQTTPCYRQFVRHEKDPQIVMEVPNAWRNGCWGHTKRIDALLKVEWLVGSFDQWRETQDKQAADLKGLRETLRLVAGELANLKKELGVKK